MWGCGLALTLAGLGLFLATRSFVLEAIARPHIEATVGGEIEIGRIRWLGWAELEITDLRVRAKGWSGSAGEVLRIERAIVQLDPAGLRQGHFKVTQVDAEGMVVRIAERERNPGVFNIEALQPAEGGDAEGAPPGRINVRDFAVEMGIDRDGQFDAAGSISLSGDMRAQHDTPQQFAFRFVTNTEGEKGPAVLKGQFDAASLAFSASIDDLEINDGLLGLMPIELRRVVETLELEGHVDRAEFAWDGGREAEASITLGGASLRLPKFIAEDNDNEATWSNLRANLVTDAHTPPMMHVDSGKLTLVDDRVTLSDFRGRFITNESDNAEVPVQLNFSLDLSPLIDSPDLPSTGRAFAQHVFRLAPFSLQLAVTDFMIRRDGDGVVLPTVAARALAEFGIEEWSVDLNVTLTRGLPRLLDDNTHAPDPTHTIGTVLVNNGAGRYERFPYPLQGVSAHFKFDDDAITISYLVGKGPNGGSLTANGTITNPGPAAAIKINLLGQSIPADNAFRSALEGWRGETYDRLLDRNAERALRQAGVLATKETVDAARRDRIATAQRLATDALDFTQRNILERKLRRLDRVIDAGPFALDGVFDFELAILSEAGVGKPVDLIGSISIQEGHALLKDFPLPVFLLPSTIVLTPTQVQLGEGIQLITPEGGRGVVRGVINLGSSDGDEAPDIAPSLSIAAIDVAISPALLAALPPGDNERAAEGTQWPGSWKSEATRAIEAIGAKGLIDIEGTWQGSATTDPRLMIGVKLHEGTIEPDVELSTFFAEAGFVWPEGFTLHDCSASIHIDPDIIRMSDFDGRRGGGRIRADGYIMLDTEEQAIHAHFNSVELEDYLLDLIPDGPDEAARDLWTRFQPRGRFDADLDASRNARGEDTSLIVAQPHEVVLLMNGTDVTVQRHHGLLRIRPEAITIEDMLLEVGTSELTHAELLLDGTYGRVQGEEDLQLKGEVAHGHFETPVLPVLLEVLGAERLADSWIELEPSGRFDATFEYRGLPGERTDYAVDLTPQSLSVSIDEQRLHAAFDDGSIFIGPDRINLELLRAEIPGPGRLQIDGTIGIGQNIDLLLAAGFDFEALPPSGFAWLPPPLSDGLGAVLFESDGRFLVDECTIAGVWALDAPITEPSTYHFDGKVSFIGGAFDAGARCDRFGRTHRNYVAFSA